MKITIDTDTITKPVKKFSSKAAQAAYDTAKVTGHKSVNTLAIWFPKTYNKYVLWRIKKNIKEG